MAKPDRFLLIVNAGGALVAASLAGFFLMPLFSESPDEHSCFARYERAAVFGFANEDGGLRSAIELQARAGWSERGLLHNVSVREDEDASRPAAIEVKLASASGEDGGAAGSGIAFEWRPAGLAGATSACLRYQVYVPRDFNFRRSGVLPGLFGGEPLAIGEQAGERGGVSARVMWRNRGAGGITAHFAGAVRRDGQIVGPQAFTLKPGKWTSVEQEVVLNAPGQADGSLRLWIDGQMLVEETTMLWRSEDAIALSGVLAEVGYLKSVGSNANDASKDEGSAVLRLRPLEVAW